MARLAVCIVSPPGYVHSLAFQEVAETLVHGLRALGHDVVLTDDPRPPGRRPILLGANLLAKLRQKPARGAILYQLEQIDAGSAWLTPEYKALLASHPVWDYSARNAARYAALGLPAPRVVPIGYVPQLTRIAPAPDQDVDVLFYGSVNERRQRILDALRARGLRVEAPFGLYGEPRDRLIARAKVVLNVHFYEAKVFEVVRVSYLLANRKCVVSERGADAAEEREFERGVAFAAYDGLVETCARLCADPALRAARERAGFELMVSRDVVPFLREALGEPSPAVAPAPDPAPAPLDPWRGSREVKVLVVPALDRPDWPARVAAVARRLAGREDTTLGIAIPRAGLAEAPGALAAALGELPLDVVLLESPEDGAGWERVVRGASRLVLVEPAPLLEACARLAGLPVEAGG